MDVDEARAEAAGASDWTPACRAFLKTDSKLKEKIASSFLASVHQFISCSILVAEFAKHATAKV